MTIDTLGYVKELETAGIDRKVAEAHAVALRDKILPELVSKQDLKDLGYELGGVVEDCTRNCAGYIHNRHVLAKALGLGGIGYGDMPTAGMPRTCRERPISS